MTNLKELIKSGQAAIVDVRTPAEYMGGHVSGSVNIPLQDIPGRIDDLKQMGKPLVLCCASGNRSGQAQRYLASLGFSECYNAGSWLDVNFAKNN